MQNTDDSGTNVPNANDNAQELRSSPSLQSCVKCGVLKPKSEFKRKLSIAQSRAVLRNPNITTSYLADSKLCKACQPKRKPPRKLTAKEIRTRMTNGDLHKITGELKLQRLKDDLPKKRSQVMRKYWQGKKSEPYKKFKRHLQDQLNRLGNRHFASARLQDATRLQNSWNYAEGKRIMKDLLEQAQVEVEAGTFVPSDVQIASLIKPQPTKE